MNEIIRRSFLGRCIAGIIAAVGFGRTSAEDLQLADLAYEPPFKAGDLVVLKSGSPVMKIGHVRDGECMCFWESHATNKWIPEWWLDVSFGSWPMECLRLPTDEERSAYRQLPPGIDYHLTRELQSGPRCSHHTFQSIDIDGWLVMEG